MGRTTPEATKNRMIKKMTLIFARFYVSDLVGLEELGFVQSNDGWKHRVLPLIAKTRTEACYSSEKNWVTHEMDETVITGCETIVKVFYPSAEGNKKFFWWWTHEFVTHSENCYMGKELSLLKQLLDNISEKITRVEVITGSQDILDRLSEAFNGLEHRA